MACAQWYFRAIMPVDVNDSELHHFGFQSSDKEAHAVLHVPACSLKSWPPVTAVFACFRSRTLGLHNACWVLKCCAASRCAVCLVHCGMAMLFCSMLCSSAVLPCPAALQLACAHQSICKAWGATCNCRDLRTSGCTRKHNCEQMQKQMNGGMKQEQLSAGAGVPERCTVPQAAEQAASGGQPAAAEPDAGYWRAAGKDEP